MSLPQKFLQLNKRTLSIKSFSLVFHCHLHQSYDPFLTKSTSQVKIQEDQSQTLLLQSVELLCVYEREREIPIHKLTTSF